MSQLLKALALTGLGLVIAGAWLPPRRLTPSERVRGVSLGLFASDPTYDYGVMVRELAARGATDVLVVVEWSQSHRLAHDPGPGARTAPDETLVRTVRQARAAGLRVGLMPIMRLPDTAPGRWRGTLDPARPAEWMSVYADAVLDLARVAEAEHVERLVIGSELSSVQHLGDAWQALIARVRAAYGGRVAYAANWDALELPFAAALDELGVSAYFPLARPGERPDVETLTRRWRAPLARLAQLSRETGTPVFLAEVGYPSQQEAASAPWRLTDSTPDFEMQTRLFRAFCASAAEDTRLSGYYVWNWFGWGGASDAGYSPRGKPAAAVLEGCMTRGSV